jgi:hypothetical protein
MTPKALYFSFVVATALLFAASAARAEGEPIQGTPIGLEHDPQGIIANGVTDNDGRVTFRDLKPGNYILTIDGPGLVTAMDKLAPAPEPEKKSGGSSFSLGIGGGMFGGGGSRHSSSGGGQGAGPIGGNQTPSSHGGSRSSGGGVGLGMSIPIGGSSSPPERRADNGGIETVVVTAQWLSSDFKPITKDRSNSPGAIQFEMPYCRDGAGQGMRIGFAIPDAGGAVTLQLDIFDQASSGSLTSY